MSKLFTPLETDGFHVSYRLVLVHAVSKVHCVSRDVLKKFVMIFCICSGSAKTADAAAESAAASAAAAAQAEAAASGGIALDALVVSDPEKKHLKVRQACLCRFSKSDPRA